MASEYGFAWRIIRGAVTSRPRRSLEFRVRILLIEDHADTREVMVRLLSRDKATVRAVATGAEALDAMDAEPFDLVICDITLPDCTGWTLLPRLKSKQTFKSIALTAHAFHADEENSRRAGFDLHINKPVDRDSLIGAIKALLG
jgi:CheY-like chemotaxis protein